MLLLHELEARSRALFLAAYQRRLISTSSSGDANDMRLQQRQQQAGAGLGWLSVPVFFLLSALVTWELVEVSWELADSLAVPRGS